jgi:hypothetical protein
LKTVNSVHSVGLLAWIIVSVNIQRVSEISTLILTSDSSGQEQQNFYVSFFRNIIFISVSGVKKIYLQV